MKVLQYYGICSELQQITNLKVCCKSENNCTLRNSVICFCYCLTSNIYSCHEWGICWYYLLKITWLQPPKVWSLPLEIFSISFRDVLSLTKYTLWFVLAFKVWTMLVMFVMSCFVKWCVSRLLLTPIYLH